MWAVIVGRECEEATPQCKSNLTVMVTHNLIIMHRIIMMQLAVAQHTVTAGIVLQSLCGHRRKGFWL